MKQDIIELIFQLKSICFTKEESICRELGLSPAEFRGLLAMIPESDISCNILSRKMGLSVSRGSRVTDKMIESGYLQFSESKEDRRVITVRLTKKGVNIQRKIHKSLEECEKSILKKMSKEETSAFRVSMLKIYDSLLERKS